MAARLSMTGAFDGPHSLFGRPRATLRRGTVAVDVGKQFIRWGKTDILNPTDRFAPRDFLEVTDDEFLARDRRSGSVRTGRALARCRSGSRGLRRAAFRCWDVDGRRCHRKSTAPHGVVDLAPSFPDRLAVRRCAGMSSGPDSSFLCRTSMGSITFRSLRPAAFRPAAGRRCSGAMRRFAWPGGDAASRFRGLRSKEKWRCLSRRAITPTMWCLYVIQLERQSGELSLVGGYAGEIVTEQRSMFDFAPDRGLTRAFLGRAGYTIDATRDVAVEAAVRQNLDGVLGQGVATRRPSVPTGAVTLAGGGHRRRRTGLHRPVPSELPSHRNAKI